jgi:3'-phosphoadenosine 5'-phosphosulfate (PAPS) 3'-phosphatase
MTVQNRWTLSAKRTTPGHGGGYRGARVILKGLQALTPDIPVLSEEAPQSWDERQHWQRYWLVDPLDGTKEFIKRNGEFTVNIALIEKGKRYLAWSTRR